MPSGFASYWRQAAVTSLALLALGATGCSRLLNGPASAHNVAIRPTEVMNFDQLYKSNCSACHGENGKNGPSIALNNPVYLAVASDETMRNDTINGGPGELMPAFGRSAGGLLTADQVNAIVQGIRQRWAKPAMLAGVTLPPYAASHPGDAAAGAQVYAQACARCHGAAGAQGATTKPGSAGAITNPVYLSLISDQGLRSQVIAGRPDLKMPDFRNDIPGHPLTDAQITDVVAWLSSQRPPTPETHPGSDQQPAALGNTEPNAGNKANPGVPQQPGVQAMPARHPRPNTPAKPAAGNGPGPQRRTAQS